MSSKKQRTVHIHAGVSDSAKCVVYITAKYLFTTLIEGVTPSGVNACQSMLLQVPRDISLGSTTTKNSTREIHVVCIPVKYIYDNYDIPGGPCNLPVIPDASECIEYNILKVKRHSIYTNDDYDSATSLQALFIVMSYETFREYAVSVFAAPPTISQAKENPARQVCECPSRVVSGMPMCREMLDISAHRLHVSTLVSTKKNLIHLSDFFTVHKKGHVYSYITKYDIFHALYKTKRYPVVPVVPKKLPPLPLYFYPIRDDVREVHDHDVHEVNDQKLMWKFPLTF